MWKYWQKEVDIIFGREVFIAKGKIGTINITGYKAVTELKVSSKMQNDGILESGMGKSFGVILVVENTIVINCGDKEIVRVYSKGVGSVEKYVE